MPLTRSPDNVPWEALAAFLAGELPDDERRRVEQWLAEDPQHAMLLHVLRQGWAASGAGRRRYDAEAALRWIKQHTHETVPVAAPAAPVRDHAQPEFVAARRFPAVRRALLAASVAALAVGGWWVASHRLSPIDGRSSPSVFVAEYRTAPGQRLALRLPDGSAVTLAPASVLRIPAGYTASARDVKLELEGEAYFDVAHNSARQLSVWTRNAVVRDLGTRFVVRAYADDKITDVAVTQGLVAIGRTGARRGGATALHSSDSLVVGPGQRGRLTDDGALVLASRVQLDEYFDWTKGRLVFRDTPLPEAVRRISRWYGVSIRLGDRDLSGRTLNTAFDGDEPAAEVARLVGALFGLAVESDGGGFVLRSPLRR